jgi:hypothetical protein
MSRRYGRNQKRAHRQRIVELEEAYTRERHLLAYLRNQLDGLRAEIEDAKRELGANFIAFRPQTVLFVWTTLRTHGAIWMSISASCR